MTFTADAFAVLAITSLVVVSTVGESISKGKQLPGSRLKRNFRMSRSIRPNDICKDLGETLGREE